jgi:hypothetical protein
MLDEEDASGSDSDDDDEEDTWRNWSIVIDESSGREYYVNNKTSETRWVCPNCMLKDNWDSSKDDQGRVYYYNKETNETSWEPPYRKECDPLLQPGKPYSEQETYVFTNMMNQLLNYTVENEENDGGTNIYTMTKSGLVIGRLINTIEPDTLDERALNGITIDDEDDDNDNDATTSNMTIKQLMSIQLTELKSIENHKLCMNCLNTLGISIDMNIINPAHMAMGDPYCINELLYLLLLYHSQKSLNVNNNKNIYMLCDDYTDKDQLGKLRTMTGTNILHLWIKHMAPNTDGVSFINDDNELDRIDRYNVNSEQNLKTTTAVAQKMFEDECGDTLESTLHDQKICNW